MRATTKNTLKDRKVVELNDFAGVDFSSAPSNVATKRASDMRNFIKLDGLNHKRNGWKELFNFDGVTVNDGYAHDFSTAQITGIYSFKYSNSTQYIIVIGNYFFKAVYNSSTHKYTITNLNTSATNSTYHVNAYSDGLNNVKSQGFYSNGKLYIKTESNFVVYNGYELRNMYEDAYVPTTTISIEKNGAEDTTRASKDSPNLLTNRRINTLIGDNQSIIHTWQLDSNLLHTLNNETDYPFVRVTVTTSNGVKTYVNLPNTMQKGNSLSSSNYPYCKSNELYFSKYLFEEKEYQVNLTLNQGKSYIDGQNVKNNRTLQSPTTIGAITDLAIGEITFSGELKLYASVDVSPLVEGYDNIKVEFCTPFLKENFNIKYCNSCCIFGSNSNSSRLFLGGNLLTENDGFGINNLEVYSEAGDYSYFPSSNYIYIGDSKSKISGFQRISDNTLAVFKDGNAFEGNTIHLQKASYSETYDTNGNLIKTITAFPATPANITESPISSSASINFLGDNLIVSRNGVFAISLVQNVSVVERNTIERSRLINARLTKHNLANSVACVYNDMYILAVDGVCYVADSRYKHQSKDAIDNAYDYEWWYWDNVPASCFLVDEDNLLFGTTNGKVCIFDNEYSDRRIVSENTFGQGSLLANSSYNYISCSADLRAKLASKTEYEEVTFNIYSTSDNTSLPQLGFHYLDNGTLTSRTGQGNGFGVQLITDENRFYLTYDGEPIALDSVNSLGRATVIISKPIVAEWYTAVMDLGTNIYSKTLLRMSLTSQFIPHGKLTFGYQTSAQKRLQRYTAVGEEVFSFENFDFTSFAFGLGFASSCSVKCNERNFNYIQFQFISDNDADCVLDAFSIVYRINKLTNGVM